MLYMCKLYKHVYGEGYQLQEPVTIVGTKRAAELYAESVLPVQSETRYRETWKRHPWVTVHQVFEEHGIKKTRSGNYIQQDRITTHETPINIVLSVGEQGWTP